MVNGPNPACEDILSVIKKNEIGMKHLLTW